MSAISHTPEVRRARPLLGTFVEIAAGGIAAQRLPRAIDRAFAAIERVQRLMSFHEKTSELARLNREACKHPVPVHAETYEVLRAATRIASATRGLFDCTIAPFLMGWGYLPSRGAGACHGSGTWKDIQLLPKRRVRFTQPLCLDLGGIAKGFAVDQAIAVLQAEGVPHGCVNAGGDLRVFGKRAHPVYVRAPADPGRLLPLGCVRDMAVATSAAYFSTRQRRNRSVSPLVHPILREPFLGRWSVSVLAPSCMMADALTKAVMFSASCPAAILGQFQATAVILA